MSWTKSEIVARIKRANAKARAEERKASGIPPLPRKRKGKRAPAERKWETSRYEKRVLSLDEYAAIGRRRKRAKLAPRPMYRVLPGAPGWVREPKATIRLNQRGYDAWRLWHRSYHENLKTKQLQKVAQVLGIPFGSIHLLRQELFKVGLLYFANDGMIRSLPAITEKSTVSAEKLEAAWQTEIDMGAPPELIEKLRKSIVTKADRRTGGRGEYARGARILEDAYAEIRGDAKAPFEPTATEKKKPPSRKHFFEATKRLQELDVKHMYFRDFAFFANEAFVSMMRRKGTPVAYAGACHLHSESFIDMFCDQRLGGRVLNYGLAERTVSGLGFRDAIVHLALGQLAENRDDSPHPEIQQVIAILREKLGRNLWCWKIDAQEMAKVDMEIDLEEMARQEREDADRRFKDWEAGAERRAEEERQKEEAKAAKRRAYIDSMAPTRERYESLVNKIVDPPEGFNAEAALRLVRSYAYKYPDVLQAATARMKADA